MTKKTCIYCRKEHDQEKFTLEHAIPQFLGGSFAPDRYKTRDVCGRCNRTLGLFVDGSFARAWPVSMALRLAAFASFDPESNAGLPLVCMGGTVLSPPSMEASETCEMWLGPLGEQVLWIRPKDERLYWYTGGNPITTGSECSRAYFFFSQRSSSDPRITWRAFRDSFEGCRVVKIMCTEVQGADAQEIGFSQPDQLDLQRVEFFRRVTAEEATGHLQFALNIRYDHRFLAKLAIAVVYCLFGWQGLNTAYGDELFRALWYREGDSPPGMLGVTPLSAERDPRLLAITGDEHAVTVILMPTGDALSLNLNIGGKQLWSVKCANLRDLPKDRVEQMAFGQVIFLYRQLQFGIEMSLADYIAHKNGRAVNQRLATVQKLIGKHLEYLAKLGRP